MEKRFIVTDLEPKEVARFIADCVQRKIAKLTVS